MDLKDNYDCPSCFINPSLPCRSCNRMDTQQKACVAGCNDRETFEQRMSLPVLHIKVYLGKLLVREYDIQLNSNHCEPDNIGLLQSPKSVGSIIYSAYRREVIAALGANSGNRYLAAKELGISERTLYRKIKEYKLNEE
jgi:transcriptional regulator of acetoin/glycerol metabolism